MSKKKMYSNWFFAPAMAIFVIFFIIPLVIGLYFSLTIWDFKGAAFVGLENYIKIFKDDLFVRSFVNTVCFVLIILPCQGIGALGLALLINKVTH